MPKLNSLFIAPYACASVLATCKYDSICALFVVKVALTLALALLTTTGAAICAWLICVCISMITFYCVCFTVIPSWIATLVAWSASSNLVGRSALLSCRDWIRA